MPAKASGSELLGMILRLRIRPRELISSRKSHDSGVLVREDSVFTDTGVAVLLRVLCMMGDGDMDFLEASLCLGVSLSVVSSSVHDSSLSQTLT